MGIVTSHIMMLGKQCLTFYLKNDFFPPFFFFADFIHAFQRVVFAACDPQSFDLPDNYRWIAPSALAGEICFRYQMTCVNFQDILTMHCLFAPNHICSLREWLSNSISPSIASVL